MSAFHVMLVFFLQIELFVLNDRNCWNVWVRVVVVDVAAGIQHLVADTSTATTTRLLLGALRFELLQPCFERRIMSTRLGTRRLGCDRDLGLLKCPLHRLRLRRLPLFWHQRLRKSWALLERRVFLVFVVLTSDLPHPSLLVHHYEDAVRLSDLA